MTAEMKRMILLSAFLHLLAGIIPVFFFNSSKKQIITFNESKYTIVDLVVLPKKKKPKLKPKKYLKKIRKKIKKKKPVKRKAVKKKVRALPKPVKEKEEDRFLEQLAALRESWADDEEKFFEEKEKRERDVREENREQEKKLEEIPEVNLAKSSGTIKIDSLNFSSQYLQFLQASINENWKAPLKQPFYDGVKRVVVFFKIYRTGDIAEVTIEESSGISSLDMAAKQALWKTTYLPPLPDEFLERFLGVHFTFEYLNPTAIE